jgi:glycosyltransferase involved in cell wall biosynthesis
LAARWPIGGIRTYFRYVLAGAPFRRFQFVLVSPRMIAEEEAALRSALEPANVEYVFCGESHGAYAGALAREIGRPGTAIVHSHGFTAGALTVAPARLRGVPHLMTAHEVLRADQFVGLPGRVKRVALGLTFRGIEVIHAVTEDAGRNLKEFLPLLGNHRIVTISHGIDVGRFGGTGALALKKQLGLPDDCFLVGFFGRFMEPKGFGYLIDAVEILANQGGVPRRLAVVAVGSGGFVREEQALIRRKGIERFFHFLPFQENIADTLRAVDVVAMPSVWEACGLLAMESLVAGVPLVGSNCVGLREVLADTPASMFPSKDSSALAQALQRHMKDPRGYRERAIAFRGEAARRFDVRHAIERTSALYEELAVR